MQAAIRKVQNKQNDIEKKIEDLESKQAKLNEQLADPANARNSAKLNELTNELNSIDEQLMEAMEIWEEISKEYEALTSN